MSGQRFYIVASWTIIRDMESLLQAAEMWFIRRMLKVLWSQRISNAEVLQRADTRRDLMKSVNARRIQFVCYVLSEESLENLVLTGKVEGHRARGRQQLTFLRWLERATGIQPLAMTVTLKQRRERYIMTATYVRILARRTE